MIELHKDMYVLAIIFVPHSYDANAQMDWMGVISRDPPDSEWKLDYRFRYHNAADHERKHDRESWYHLRMLETTDADTVLDTVLRAANKLAQRNKTYIEPKIVDGDGLKAFEMLKTLPWAHIGEPNENA